MVKVIKCASTSSPQRQKQNPKLNPKNNLNTNINPRVTKGGLCLDEGNSGEDSMMFDKKPLSVGLMDLLLSSPYEAKQFGHETSFAGLIS